MKRFNMNSLFFWKSCTGVLFLALIGIISTYLVYYRNFEEFEVTNDLAGNIFPSVIVSTASTGTKVIIPATKNWIGKPESGFGIRLKAVSKNCKVHIELSETPFFSMSVSDFILPIKDMEYTIYPDVLWDYEALKKNNQAQPISFAISVQINKQKPVQKNVTYSVRAINDCLLAYKDENMNLHDTSIYFAAYVNEEHPQIDNLLREALNTKIVRRFVGTQLGADRVDNQVFALWNMLQKRNFKYCSISYSNLASNMVFCQRVRTIDDALETAQINCVDGTVLFASLLRAINIEPVMVRVPGHMFVGYYPDSKKDSIQYLETTMVGDVSYDDFFPDENIDSISETKSQLERSRLTFEKAKEYALNKFKQYNKSVDEDGNSNVQTLSISKSIRSKVQPIGR